jgi:hypothetical protein
VPRRLAVAVALLVFAVCLVSGMAAENSFAETIRRALIGMFVTLVVGLVVGAMGQKMLEENVAGPEKKSQDSETKPQAGDR